MHIRIKKHYILYKLTCSFNSSFTQVSSHNLRVARITIWLRILAGLPLMETGRMDGSRCYLDREHQWFGIHLALDDSTWLVTVCRNTMILLIPNRYCLYQTDMMIMLIPNRYCLYQKRYDDIGYTKQI